MELAKHAGDTGEGRGAIAAGPAMKSTEADLSCGAIRLETHDYFSHPKLTGRL